jgi:hypothetical protein
MANEDLIKKPSITKLLKAKNNLSSIDDDARFKNLPSGYWVYDELLRNLKSKGWVRFAPGFKAGLYGHPQQQWCIKLLGMGVGDNPLYFCERGYYLEHERNVLLAFKNAGFTFQPDVMTSEDTVKFLIEHCGVSEEQAKLRTTNNDLLIMEYIDGVPFATQTGHFLNYIVNYNIPSSDVLAKMIDALTILKAQLMDANTKGLVNNDPMPPNIIFTSAEKKRISARLVDFELAQNLNTTSPDYVSNSVQELYRERNVPFNIQTNKYIKNLDEHLIDESINKLKELPSKESTSFLDGISFSIPFLPYLSIDVGKIASKIRKKL